MDDEKVDSSLTIWFEEGVKTQSISDLERLTKLFLLLEGEATEKEERVIFFEDVDGRTDLTEEEKKEFDLSDKNKQYEDSTNNEVLKLSS